MTLLRDLSFKPGLPVEAHYLPHQPTGMQGQIQLIASRFQEGCCAPDWRKILHNIRANLPNTAGIVDILWITCREDWGRALIYCENSKDNQ